MAARIRSLEITVGEYVQLRNARPSADGTQFADYNKFAGRSRMNMPVMLYSLLVYHSAHTLILPNVESFSYRTRELSERFGERKDFLFNLQNVLHDLEGGEGVWSPLGE
ncbi:MAG: hypothetical protein ABSE16_10950 [Verrucomicrobiota bacterium]|jgi:hypothetical protein